MTENPFETHAQMYDAWYDQMPTVLASEVLALRALLPAPGDWVEVGVGTGRFAEQLGIPLGVEPAAAMAAIARSRGIRVLAGQAEALPLATESQDAVFFITALCFVRDLVLALREAHRVLRPAGRCVIGLLPGESQLGDAICLSAQDDVFFKQAHLRTVVDVLVALESAGFAQPDCVQTLLGSPASFADAVQQPVAGHKGGSFVVLSASLTTLGN